MSISGMIESVRIKGMFTLTFRGFDEALPVK